MRSRRGLLTLLVVLVLAVTGLATGLTTAANPSAVPGGLTVSMNAASTALYCTGLTSAKGAPARVVFYNASSASRSLAITVTSDTRQTSTSTVELAGHASTTVRPSTLAHGHFYGVGAQVSGGGVVGEVIASSNHSEVPCRAQGVTRWFASGLSTLVGSSALVSLYNPTATAAVFDVALYSADGTSSPVAFQGVAVAAHAVSQINLGGAIVNTADVGVQVHVVRGSLQIVAIQDVNGVTSLDAGVSGSSTRAWFPAATTVEHANAEVMIANPSDEVVKVSVSVDLSTYHVASQAASIAPYSTGLITITPNSAIPAAGYASLEVSSNVPVVSTLATGTANWFTLSAPSEPADALLVRNFTALGFDGASLTNTSSRPLSVSIATLDDHDTKGSQATTRVTLPAGGTVALASSIPGLLTTKTQSFLVSAPSASMVIGLTLPTSPQGLEVVSPLDGR